MALTPIVSSDIKNSSSLMDVLENIDFGNWISVNSNPNQRSI
jgi:hypothetical protein